jgi:hypothetical protein
MDAGRPISLRAEHHIWHDYYRLERLPGPLEKPEFIHIVLFLTTLGAPKSNEVPFGQRETFGGQ